MVWDAQRLKLIMYIEKDIGMTSFNLLSVGTRTKELLFIV